MLDSDGWAVETKGVLATPVVYTPRGANRGAYSFLRPGFGQNPLTVLPVGRLIDWRALINRSVESRQPDCEVVDSSEAATASGLQEGGYGNASLMDRLPERCAGLEPEDITKVGAADERAAMFLSKPSFVRSNTFFDVHPCFRRELAASNIK